MSEKVQENALFIAPIREKIRMLPFNIEMAWKNQPQALQIPSVAPGRDLLVLAKGRRGEKKGLSSREGQARLLHDLANIELQAMELAYRSFVEYPEAPQEFREQMAELALSESKHLELCLDQLELLGFKWGDWPVYLSLWNSVSIDDSLLDRLLIVHRYLEASGLDAGVSLLKKLAQAHAPHIERVVRKITDEEIDHVAFGSRWYQQFCHEQNIDPNQDFKTRMKSLMVKLPKRFEVIDPDIRKKAGFTDLEIKTAIEIRNNYKK
jgi:uncharacterized ferritin-like protein (DUF455 family)